MDVKQTDAHTSDKECCNKKEKTLVKATELPIHGNPYPPKDSILNEKPSKIELQVANLRGALQPISGPISGAFERVGDIVATGMAHSQSGLQRIFGEDSTMKNPAIVATSALVGATILGRRRAFPIKLFYGSLLSAGSYTYLYPEDMKSKALSLISQNSIKNTTQKLGSFVAKESALSTNTASTQVEEPGKDLK